MPSTNLESSDLKFPALADQLASRRDLIVAAWRAAVEADSTLTTGNSLPRVQLVDHIPALLEGFEAQLREPNADVSHLGDAAAHGLHRWQQGFGLAEVSRELGHLNECVVKELDTGSKMQPAPELHALVRARQLWAAIFSVAVSASTSQYFKLQEMEAASYMHELEAALHDLRNLERQRAMLWQQAAHDLRGNLGVVANVTAGLGFPNLDGSGRENFLRMLERNVQSLHKLLDDITCLARLQGGQEPRQLGAVNVAAILTDMNEHLCLLAAAQGLSFELSGEQDFWVESDAVKLHRIVQNLTLNAIRYTKVGGVKVSWEKVGPKDPDRWALVVEDTGPGFDAGPASDVLGALQAATENANEVARAAQDDQVTHSVSKEPVPSSSTARGGSDSSAPTLHGEGIGLAIVKRLCDLLGATVHVESGRGGTCFRILIPIQYFSCPSTT